MKHPIRTSSSMFLAVFLSAGSVAAVPVGLYDFDDGTLQGWTRDPPFGGSLFVDPVGGNPGGLMVATDTVVRGGGLLARAPAPVSGDLSGFAGLQWDEFVYNNGRDTVIGTSVILRGSDGTEYGSPNLLGPVGVFNTRWVPFDAPSAWSLRVGSMDFADLVRDVSALFLQLDTSVRSGGARESGVDNICLLSAPGTCATAPMATVPEPSALALAGISLLGVSLLGRVRVGIRRRIQGRPGPASALTTGGGLAFGDATETHTRSGSPAASESPAN